jgi:hypothetical protein
VEVEASHRCALPNCRQYPIEIAHIERRKTDGSNDVFENLIALCPTCHARYDRGDIDRLSMQRYKLNLAVIGRYSDMEQRVLEGFAMNGDEPVFLPMGLDALMWYLHRDGLLEKTDRKMGIIVGTDLPAFEEHGLTEKGKEFVRRWFAAEDLEDT